MEHLWILENGEKKNFPITGRVVTIGRSSKNDVSIKDRNASRKHCNIIKVGDSWFVVDCDSQNGTIVNGESVKKKELFDKDVILIGGAEILFKMTDEEESMEKTPCREGAESEVKKESADPNPETGENGLLEKMTTRKADESPLPDEISNPEIEPTPAVGKPYQKSETPVDDNTHVKPDENDSFKTPPGFLKEKSSQPAANTKMDSSSASPPNQNEKLPASLAAEKELEEDSSGYLETVVPGQVVTEGSKKQNIIKRIQKCYELFQNCIIPEWTTDERVPHFFFLTLLSGGHAFIEGSSRLHQYVLIQKMAASLALSTKTMLLASSRKMEQMVGNYNLIVVENLQEETSELLSFLLKNTPDLALPGQSFLPEGFMVLLCRRSPEAPLPLKLRENFMFHLSLPEAETKQNLALLERSLTPSHREEAVALNEEILSFQKALWQMPCASERKEYITKILSAFSPKSRMASSLAKEHLACGIESYAGVLLLKGAKAFAAIEGRDEILDQDIRTLAQHLIPPRLSLKPASLAQGMTQQTLYEKIVKQI